MLDGTVVYNSDLLHFWRDKAGIPDLLSHVYDPHLEYDYASGRWFAISLAEPSSTDSSLLVGVSDTSDPSAGWKGLVIDADPADLLFADYPYLGIDGAAIYVRFYMLEIADSAPHGADLIVLPKSDLTGAQPVTDHLSRFSFDRLGPVFDREQLARFDLYPFSKPQIDYLGTASDGLQIHSFLNRADAGYPYRITTAYQKMTGQASGEALLTAWADTTFDVESATNPQPQSLPADVGRQPGTDHLLGTNPGNNHIRVGDSVYSVDRAPVGGRQGVVWSRFQPSTNTIVDAGFIGDDAHDYLNPHFQFDV